RLTGREPASSAPEVASTSYAPTRAPAQVGRLPSAPSAPPGSATGQASTESSTPQGAVATEAVDTPSHAAAPSVTEDEDERDDTRRGRGDSSGSGFTADRSWFGEEVWGVSPRHRSASTDPARLSRFTLPNLATERELAAWLGISLSRLRWYTHDRPADTVW